MHTPYQSLARGLVDVDPASICKLLQVNNNSRDLSYLCLTLTPWSLPSWEMYSKLCRSSNLFDSSLLVIRTHWELPRVSKKSNSMSACKPKHQEQFAGWSEGDKIG